MKEALFVLWSLICALAALATLPGSSELLLLSLAALPEPKRAPDKNPRGPWRVAVVVPAHNEATGITPCLVSLHCAADAAAADAIETTLFVIADNCTDHTAEAAQAAGARVLMRHDELRRGKGYALDFAFTHPALNAFNAVLVVDADTLVAESFITVSASALRSGAAAVQARYVALNADETPRTRLLGLALRAFNVLRPRGRENLGLSAGIFGNGFGLRRETLSAVPYNAASVVEDLEYHLALVRSGRRVIFLDNTAVMGEMPVAGKGVETQRSRWEGGRMRMLVQHAPGLFADVLRGRWRSAEPLLDLLLLPLAFHVFLLLIACCSPQLWSRSLGVAGLAIVLLHLAATVRVSRGGWSDVRTLASAPVYILWKLLMLPKLFRSARSGQNWVRTERRSEVERDR